MQVVTASEIYGDFKGMDFERVFTLMNGQKWQQVPVHFRFSFRIMPRVMVLREGSRYFLRVDGFDEDIEVRQVY